MIPICRESSTSITWPLGSTSIWVLKLLLLGLKPGGVTLV